jgi:hypothetical protein
MRVKYEIRAVKNPKSQLILYKCLKPVPICTAEGLTALARPGTRDPTIPKTTINALQFVPNYVDG